MRTPFDQFAKQMARAGFAPAGPVHTDEEVSPDARRIDIWFTPTAPGVEEALRPLGLLGRIGLTACTLEPFHRTPGGLDVMDCVCKQHLFRGILSRREPQTPLPTQWIISSGRPDTALSGLRFEPSPEWGPGIYGAPPLTFTRLVVAAELPPTRDTLLLRLLGAGPVLARALAELYLLPSGAPERALALPILLSLRFEVSTDPTRRTEDEQEFFMSTQETVEKFIQQQRSEGRSEGRGEGVREDVVDLFVQRFGEPPADVAAIVERTKDVAVLRGWLRLVAWAPEEEVLATLRGSSPR